MSKSKTAAAADKAVAKSLRKEDVVRTPQEVVADIRKNIAAGLAVTPADQRILLEQYDQSHAILAQTTKLLQSATDETERQYKEIDELKAQVATLTEKNQEFRDVYEQENRSTVLRVDVLELQNQVNNGPNECGTLLTPIEPHEIDRFHDDGGPVVES